MMESNYLKVIEQLEKQKYRFRCYYNTCIKLLDYEFSNNKNKNDIIKGKKIYIYGCGNIGKMYYKAIQNSANILAFIDQSAKDNEYKYENTPVISLNKINHSTDFDYIIITLEDLYQVIYDNLINNGIDRKKIKSIDEMLC